MTLERLDDPRRAPPPLEEPFQITFPDELPREAPGLWAVLQATGARFMECGMTVEGPTGERLQNQCFYLSLAAAARAPGEPLQAVADDTRAKIEQAVREARPTWQDADFIGQEVGAFADFLIWGLQKAPRLRGRAVAVYDGRTGTCEVFRPAQLANRRDPVLAVWHTGAHYRWVQWTTPDPTLHTLLGLHRAGPANSPRVPTLVTNTTG